MPQEIRPWNTQFPNDFRKYVEIYIVVKEQYENHNQYASVLFQFEPKFQSGRIED